MGSYCLLLLARVLTHFTCVQLFETLRTVARQAPLSMGFSRQDHWSGLPGPPPEDLPDPGKTVSEGGGLQSTGVAKRVGDDLATEQQGRPFWQKQLTHGLR